MCDPALDGYSGLQVPNEGAHVTNLPAGNAKLIQYLNEAYGTERRLEVALQAHIGLATRATYKNRLRDHLSETKRHARAVAKRVKALGGTAEAVDVPGPDALGGVAQIAVTGAQRAAALAQGSIHALRGTSEPERQLKNAKTEYASEAEEIAIYSAIISAAEALGDQETVKLARSSLREEQRMSAFLEREIPRMAGAVVVAEVPRSQRAGSGRSRSGRSRARRPTARRSTARSRGASSSRSGARGSSAKRTSSSSAGRSSAKRASSSRGGTRSTRRSSRAGRLIGS
jgi:ferritin-like metal-binding protein YciE